ncbi:hypothetical protein EDB81DRAFT_813330 [Dactylonectria macrodidyma]|uniref:Secreted protein n=1 Tax=Dactylonectria macrodidyma TaxID=307937 RepID=A0A9P9IKS5_9HYPO|nr:hypothetical protein EDB81DRAFT_813330 [Dactylonectria macrodidyma]
MTATRTWGCLASLSMLAAILRRSGFVDLETRAAWYLTSLGRSLAICKSFCLVDASRREQSWGMALSSRLKMSLPTSRRLARVGLRTFVLPLLPTLLSAPPRASCFFHKVKKTTVFFFHISSLLKPKLPLLEIS